MKKLLLPALILIAFYANGQSWFPLGSPGFSSGPALFTSIAIDGSGTPYVVYEDEGSSNYGATVMKYNGSSWVNVGSTGFSAGEVQWTNIAIDSSGTPYVAYQDWANGMKVTVMKYNGSSWVTVGSAGFSAGAINSLSMAIDSGGTPYVVYSDLGNSEKATVMKYNGSSWENVGSPGFSNYTVWYTSIAIDGSGTPYVVYDDDSSGELLAFSGPATVMKFNGTSWETVGSWGFSAGTAYYTSIAIDTGGTPYVVYEDSVYGGSATVMKFNGSSWVNVGSPGFSTPDSYFTSIAIDGTGTPYVAYANYSSFDDLGLIDVMKYNGSSWVNVGSQCSDSIGQYSSIAIDGSGTPYVAFFDFSADDGNSGQASVMKYGWSTSVNTITNATTSLSVFPNPNNGSFTLNISSPQNEPAAITITNILGEKVKELSTTTNTDTQIEMDSPAGIYFVTAVIGSGVVSGKVEVW